RSRNVFRQPEKRNVPPPGLCHTRPGTHGSGRIHRSILQSPTTPFQPRLPHPSPSLDRPPRPHRNGINHSGLTRKKTRATCPKTLTQPTRPRQCIRGSTCPDGSLHAWRAELHVYLALHAMRDVYRSHVYLQQVLFLLLPCHHGST